MWRDLEGLLVWVLWVYLDEFVVDRYPLRAGFGRWVGGIFLCEVVDYTLRSHRPLAYSINPDLVGGVIVKEF